MIDLDVPLLVVPKKKTKRLFFYIIKIFKKVQNVRKVLTHLQSTIN